MHKEEEKEVEREGGVGGGGGAEEGQTTKVVRTSTRVPYLFLSLNLPPAPLFKDTNDGKLDIPQVAIQEILKSKLGLRGDDEASGESSDRHRASIFPPFPCRALPRRACRCVCFCVGGCTGVRV